MPVKAPERREGNITKKGTSLVLYIVKDGLYELERFILWLCIRSLGLNGEMEAFDIRKKENLERKIVVLAVKDILYSNWSIVNSNVMGIVIGQDCKSYFCDTIQL